MILGLRISHKNRVVTSGSSDYAISHKESYGIYEGARETSLYQKQGGAAFGSPAGSSFN